MTKCNSYLVLCRIYSLIVNIHDQFVVRTRITSNIFYLLWIWTITFFKLSFELLNCLPRCFFKTLYQTLHFKFFIWVSPLDHLKFFFTIWLFFLQLHLYFPLLTESHYFCHHFYFKKTFCSSPLYHAHKLSKPPTFFV